MAANSSNINLITICSLLLLLCNIIPSSMAAEPEYQHGAKAPAQAKKSDVVVEGVVYCQSCKYAGTWSLAGAKPISNARVGVTCKSSRGQVSFYKAYEADKHGYFYAQLDGFKMSHEILDHPLQACNVKLVSSPVESCNVRTNVNYGIDGSKLRSEGKVLRSPRYEAVIYATGPLAFRPEQCSNYHG